MTSFTDVYTNLPINPSEVAYSSLTISSDTTLNWPSVSQEGGIIASGIMQITATTGGLKLNLPDATQVSPGQSILFVNVGSNAFTICDNSGNTIQSASPGTTNYIYLIDNTSTDGSWAVILFGANAASVNASALAGAGLLAIASTLNQNSPITANSGAYTLSAGDRANTLRNTGGSVAYTSQSPSVLGNGWYVQIKNSGTGAVTFTPSSGTIDGNANIILNPGSSVIIATDGSNFYSLFLTTTNTISYTRLVKSVAGSSDVTLTSTESAFSILSFTGALTGDINIKAQAAVMEWIVENNTTGVHTAIFKTTAGTGVTLGPAGTSNIDQTTVNPCYCDGTNIRLSVTIPSAQITNVTGGTGIIVSTTSGIAVVSISSTGVSPGIYGDASDIPQITINAQGQATAASSIPLVVTNSILAPMPAFTFKMNATSSSANPTDATAAQASAVLGSPVSGQVSYFAMNTAPSGWLIADGSAISRTTYSILFSAIGTIFGSGDGSTTFNIPDLRGEFIRGWDDSRGVDPGRSFGSTQTDEMQGHRHSPLSPSIGIASFQSGTAQYAGGSFGINEPTTGDPVTDGTNGTPRTGTETRPVNVALLACIKY